MLIGKDGVSAPQGGVRIGNLVTRRLPIKTALLNHCIHKSFRSWCQRGARYDQAGTDNQIAS